MNEQQSSKARVCENDLRIIYEHGQPHGIRDRSGYLFFFRKVWKYDGQEERYRRELEQMARLADFLLDALKRSTDEPKPQASKQACEHFQCVGPGSYLPVQSAHTQWQNCPWCEIARLKRELAWAMGAAGTGVERHADEPKAGAQSMSEQPTSNQHLSWADMFAQLCQRHTGQRIADAIGVSEQYVSDLRRGMRRPTVEITDKICDWMGRGPKGRLEWHQAGARAHGWRV